MARIAVVIPCFNEAADVGKVVRDFATALPQAEIFVFDNASTDDTAAVASAAGARVVASPRRGKGNVVRHAASAVDADVYVLVDGDDTYSAEAAPALVERLQREGLDMLVATRLEEYESGAFRTFHRVGNRWISGLIRRLFGTELTDVLSGYRVLSREFFEIVQIRSEGFEVETEMTLQALSKQLAVAEEPFAYRSRGAGSESKLSTWSDGFLIARCILMLFKDYKPLAFFGAVSVLLAVGALASGGIAVSDFVQTGYVYHVPRAILGAALGILSVVAFTAGLILDTIAKNHAETLALWKKHLGERR